MYLFFDIGGTNTRIAISHDGESFEEPKILPTPADFNEGIALLKKVASEIIGGGEIKAAVGGVPGVLNKDKSRLLSAPHLKNWGDKSLKEELEKAFGADIYLENDAVLAALGEAVYGAGRGKRIVAYLTVSTGVGGARVVDGKLDANVFGFEPGRQIINDGKNLEYYVSGAGMTKRYGKPPEEINDRAVWDETARWLAQGINNTIAFWSSDVVVLGGSVMKSIPMDKVKSYLDALNEFPEIPEIALAELGYKGGLFGALARAKFLHSVQD